MNMFDYEFPSVEFLTQHYETYGLAFPCDGDTRTIGVPELEEEKCQH